MHSKHKKTDNEIAKAAPSPDPHTSSLDQTQEAHHPRRQHIGTQGLADSTGPMHSAILSVPSVASPGSEEAAVIMSSSGQVELVHHAKHHIPRHGHEKHQLHMRDASKTVVILSSSGESNVAASSDGTELGEVHEARETEKNDPKTVSDPEDARTAVVLSSSGDSETPHAILASSWSHTSQAPKRLVRSAKHHIIPKQSGKKRHSPRRVDSTTSLTKVQVQTVRKPRFFFKTRQNKTLRGPPLKDAARSKPRKGQVVRATAPNPLEVNILKAMQGELEVLEGLRAQATNAAAGASPSQISTADFASDATSDVSEDVPAAAAVPPPVAASAAATPELPAAPLPSAAQPAVPLPPAPAPLPGAVPAAPPAPAPPAPPAPAAALPAPAAAAPLDAAPVVPAPQLAAPAAEAAPEAAAAAPAAAPAAAAVAPAQGTTAAAPVSAAAAVSAGAPVSTDAAAATAQSQSSGTSSLMIGVLVVALVLVIAISGGIIGVSVSRRRGGVLPPVAGTSRRASESTSLKRALKRSQSAGSGLKAGLGGLQDSDDTATSGTGRKNDGTASNSPVRSGLYRDRRGKDDGKKAFDSPEAAAPEESPESTRPSVAQGGYKASYKSRFREGKSSTQEDLKKPSRKEGGDSDGLSF